MQVVLIVNSLVFFALSFITVPLYSLGVQMGSDFRPHIFTSNVKNRMLDMAAASKEKVCSQQIVVEIMMHEHHRINVTYTCVRAILCMHTVHYIFLFRICCNCRKLTVADVNAFLTNSPNDDIP